MRPRPPHVFSVNFVQCVTYGYIPARTVSVLTGTMKHKTTANTRRHRPLKCA